MEIPGLGSVRHDSDGWYRSDAVAVPALGNATCHVLVSGYDDDSAKEDFHAAIAAFLALDESVLRGAAPPIFEYYQDIASEFPDDVPAVSRPDDVWQHIHPGSEDVVERDR